VETSAANAVDVFGRPMRSLRLSVTDRCNLRCAYCMPEEEYRWLERSEVLRFEELSTLTDSFGAVGVTRLRLTGGEPLVRKDLPELVRLLAAKTWVTDLALTTNGVLLAEQASALKEAGLQRITVSIDTLSADRFRRLTRRNSHAQVLDGIAAAVRVQFPQGVKLDSVIVRGVNDDELSQLLEFAGACGAELRFIEYMDVGGATQWRRDEVVSRAEILSRVKAVYGSVESLPAEGSAPAERFRLRDGRYFGIIASTTQPFCSSCDRARLTADGTLFTCLYAKRGLDLKTPLRAGADAKRIASMLETQWRRRSDRGAEARLALVDRGPLVGVDQLRIEPKLEMHTRGG
jgi:cyclic pyranopterin phosphate synthase